MTTEPNELDDTRAPLDKLKYPFRKPYADDTPEQLGRKLAERHLQEMTDKMTTGPHIEVIRAMLAAYEKRRKIVEADKSGFNEKGAIAWNENRDMVDDFAAIVRQLLERVEELEEALRSIEHDARLDSNPDRAHSCQISFDELLSSFGSLAETALRALNNED